MVVLLVGTMLSVFFMTWLGSSGSAVWTGGNRTCECTGNITVGDISIPPEIPSLVGRIGQLSHGQSSIDAVVASFIDNSTSDIRNSITNLNLCSTCSSGSLNYSFIVEMILQNISSRILPAVIEQESTTFLHTLMANGSTYINVEGLFLNGVPFLEFITQFVANHTNAVSAGSSLNCSAGQTVDLPCKVVFLGGMFFGNVPFNESVMDLIQSSPCCTAPSSTPVPFDPSSNYNFSGNIRFTGLVDIDSENNFHIGGKTLQQFMNDTIEGLWWEKLPDGTIKTRAPTMSFEDSHVYFSATKNFFVGTLTLQELINTYIRELLSTSDVPIDVKRLHVTDTLWIKNETFCEYVTGGCGGTEGLYPPNWPGSAFFQWYPVTTYIGYGIGEVPQEPQCEYIGSMENYTIPCVLADDCNYTVAGNPYTTKCGAPWCNVTIDSVVYLARCNVTVPPTTTHYVTHISVLKVSDRIIGTAVFQDDVIIMGSFYSTGQYNEFDGSVYIGGTLDVAGGCRNCIPSCPNFSGCQLNVSHITTINGITVLPNSTDSGVTFGTDTRPLASYLERSNVHHTESGIFIAEGDTVVIRSPLSQIHLESSGIVLSTNASVIDRPFHAISVDRPVVFDKINSSGSPTRNITSPSTLPGYSFGDATATAGYHKVGGEILKLDGSSHDCCHQAHTHAHFFNRDHRFNWTGPYAHPVESYLSFQRIDDHVTAHFSMWPSGCTTFDAGLDPVTGALVSVENVASLWSDTGMLYTPQDIVAMPIVIKNGPLNSDHIFGVFSISLTAIIVSASANPLQGFINTDGFRQACFADFGVTYDVHPAL